MTTFPILITVWGDGPCHDFDRFQSVELTPNSDPDLPMGIKGDYLEWWEQASEPWCFVAEVNTMAQKTTLFLPPSALLKWKATI